MAKFAATLLGGEAVAYLSNPLEDFALAAFLERFVYVVLLCFDPARPPGARARVCALCLTRRVAAKKKNRFKNPKKTIRPEHGSSLMQPATSGRRLAAAAAPLNAGSFVNKPISEIPVDQVIF